MTNQTEAIFEKVSFNSTIMGNSNNPTNWKVFAKNIELINFRADSVLSGNIYLDNRVEGSVTISNLIWNNITGTQVGFAIITSKLFLYDSSFINSTSALSLFVVLNVSDSDITVSLSNVTFNYNQINDHSFFQIVDNSNIIVINSSFTCNTYMGDSSGLVLPFFCYWIR